MSDYFINNPSNIIPKSLTTNILEKSNAHLYHASLINYQPTPLIKLSHLAKKYNVGNIYIKDEASRLGLNAFKGLGASYAISEIIKTKPNIETFCTATDGNHGRAVAWASTLAGKKSVIFVPIETTKNRIEAIKNEGATVIQLDKNYDEVCDFAKKKSEEEGWELIQDAAWENYEMIPGLIKAGYVTHFKELEDDLHTLPLPKIDIVFLQAGVGSWAASAIWYYLNRYQKKRPKIVIVEPYESDGILASFKENKRTKPHGNFQTIMSGLNCGIPSLTAWEFIKNGVDVSLKVKDEYAKRSIKELFFPIENDKRIIAGESGVGGLAGFMALMTEKKLSSLNKVLNINKKTNILFYNTEGATDIDDFKKIVEAKSSQKQ